MKTRYYTAASVDGFIATDGHSLEWLFPLGDINDTSYPEFIRGVRALAMGASTYEWMLRHVVDRGQPWPYAQPTWVFSHRPQRSVGGADIRFVAGDVRPVHAAMREAAAGAATIDDNETRTDNDNGDTTLWIVGGGDLAGQFHDAGLLDELIVQVGSVTLGHGKPLLPRAITRPSMKLVAVRHIGPGFAELRYELPKKAA